MKKVTYGILGTGAIVERFVRAVEASSGGEVVALASRELEKAKRKAHELDIPKAYGSYEALVKDENIQVVYVPTINKAHKENALLALSHGKHVLVEKPMTLNIDDTKKLFEEAEKRGLFIMEAQKSLFLPVTLEAKRLLQEGLLGKVHLLEYDIYVPGVTFSWFYERAAGGGALLGSGNYIFCHAMDLLGEPFVDMSGMATLGEEVDLESLFHLRSKSGVLLQGKITTLSHGESRCVIHGEKGKILIQDFWKARSLEVRLHEGEHFNIHHPVDYEMVYEINHVNECILQGVLESPVMTKDYSLASAVYMDTLYEHYYKEL